MKKILFCLIILFNFLNAQSDKFIDLYYESVADRLAKWTPTEEKEREIANIKIIINEVGKFDYKIIKLANSEKFNKSLKNFLEEQKNIKYPIYKNRIMKIDVDFKSES